MGLLTLFVYINATSIKQQKDKGDWKGKRSASQKVSYRYKTKGHIAFIATAYINASHDFIHNEK